jgi:thymidine phosphorylase
VNGRALGEALVRLGAGRLVGTDRVNPSVGLSGLAMIGEEMGAGEVLAMVHAPDEARAERAVAAVQAAYAMTEEPPEEPPLIHGRIGPEDVA